MSFHFIVSCWRPYLVVSCSEEEFLPATAAPVAESLRNLLSGINWLRHCHCLLLIRAGLTTVPVVPWEVPPPSRGLPDQLPDFYHAVWMFRNHKFCVGFNVPTTKKGCQLFRGRKVHPLRKNPGYAHEKRAPHLMLVWGPPEWLIRPCLLTYEFDVQQWHGTHWWNKERPWHWFDTETGWRWKNPSACLPYDACSQG